MMWINKTTGAILRTYSDVRKDASRVSFPSNMTDEMVLAHGYDVVTPTIPTYDATREKATEAEPVEVNGQMVQQWAISSLTQAEIDAAAARAKALTDAIAARADAKLAALGNMTPAQARAWVQANVSNLADAKDVLGTLAAAVSVLSRRL